MLHGLVSPSQGKSRPSVPTRFEVTNVTEDSATLTWLPPERDGGSRIFNYIIESREAAPGSTWHRVKTVNSSDNLVATIDGLREGRSYYFRIHAVNAVGSGPHAEPKDSVIPKRRSGPPMPPQGPIRVIRVTRNMLAIHWIPSPDNGGSPIERYIIEKREADRSHWMQAGTCSPEVSAYCVTDLAENTMYYFRILAENAYGCSDPLEFEKPVIPKRIYESAKMADMESLLREAYQESSSSSYLARRSSVTRQTMTSHSQRMYSAYGDEPLTSSTDTLDFSSWASRH
jgi:titin